MGGPTTATGAKLGRYQIVKHLASGGMAEVLLARATGIEGFTRHVVIKRIRPGQAKDQAFVQMFLDEARIAAQLHHANIVQVHDIGQEGNEYFFAMEYVHGEDLRRLLTHVARNRQKVPLEHVVTIICAAAVALHHAHEQRGPDRKPLGIVHRDVTPANILVGYDGNVKVVDFGIAKAAVKTEETQAGVLKGKSSYMSPEQCTGGRVDRRSDVFALGIVLYELVTARRLFKAENDFLTMSAIVAGKVPSPRTHRPDLPEALEAIIMKALALDPEDRYQTADEMREALEQFAADAGLRMSTSALAAYMKQQFGERPEPWLVEDDEPEVEVVVDFDGSASALVSPPDESLNQLEIPSNVDADTGSPIAKARTKAITNRPESRKPVAPAPAKRVLPLAPPGVPGKPLTAQIPTLKAVPAPDKPKFRIDTGPVPAPQAPRRKPITVQIPTTAQVAATPPARASSPAIPQPQARVQVPVRSQVPSSGVPEDDADVSDSAVTTVADEVGSAVPRPVAADVDDGWDTSMRIATGSSTDLRSTSGASSGATARGTDAGARAPLEGDGKAGAQARRDATPIPVIKARTDATPTPKPRTDATPIPVIKARTDATPTPASKPRSDATPAPTAKPRADATPIPVMKARTDATPTPASKPRTDATPAPTAKPRADATPIPAIKARTDATPSPMSKPRGDATPPPTAKPRADATPVPSVKPRGDATPVPSVKPRAASQPDAGTPASVNAPTPSAPAPLGTPGSSTATSTAPASLASASAMPTQSGAPSTPTAEAASPSLVNLASTPRADEGAASKFDVASLSSSRTDASSLDIPIAIDMPVGASASREEGHEDAGPKTRDSAPLLPPPPTTRKSIKLPGVAQLPADDPDDPAIDPLVRNQPGSIAAELSTPGSAEAQPASSIPNAWPDGSSALAPLSPMRALWKSPKRIAIAAGALIVVIAVVVFAIGGSDPQPSATPGADDRKPPPAEVDTVRSATTESTTESAATESAPTESTATESAPTESAAIDSPDIPAPPAPTGDNVTAPVEPPTTKPATTKVTKQPTKVQTAKPATTTPTGTKTTKTTKQTTKTTTSPTQKKPVWDPDALFPTQKKKK